MFIAEYLLTLAKKKIPKRKKNERTKKKKEIEFEESNSRSIFI